MTVGPEIFLNNRVILWPVDCKVGLAYVNANSIDSVVTDPPYALTSVVKRFQNGEPAHTKTAQDIAGRKTPIARLAAGFMGQKWDTGETAFDPEFWKQVYRVLKPGGHVVAFGGTRSVHRLVCAIEDAGFEIRDQLSWIFGSGFPKSHNAGNGLGTALKPAHEPICLARKPLIGTVAENVLLHGTGAVNIDGCRVATEPRSTHNNGLNKNISGKIYGSGRGLPAGEYEAASSRWPANVLHDGSEEVVGAFPDAPGQQRSVGPLNGAKDSINCYGDFGPRDQFDPRGDSGSAARFFYQAKADSDDRLGFTHPTIKPVDLMQWLVRLVTPRGGMCLDPFAGTGTTGEAAFREGMRAMLIEREPEYQGFIRERMRLVMSGPDERSRETVKRKPEPPKEGLLALMEGK